ncbi:MAG: UDP-2,3-diacylglucosamine diphosphatase [Bacteroidaceae bacterium]|nr:UDP-2,3-diacylglucosamine diphosphatase [Bacteroidaceae bacterium]
MKDVYFITDAHLGCLALADNLDRERLLVHFLDSIKNSAEKVFLLGDMFDFWYEHKLNVPKGYTRFLGKLSELTDCGVEVHYFLGNHDWWCGDYLTKECGVIIHKEPFSIEMGGKNFYMAHGDGLGRTPAGFRFLRRMFHSRFLRFCFSTLHPRISLAFGLKWASNSMSKHKNAGVDAYMGEDKEPLVLYAKDYLHKNPQTNFMIFGHRHIELDLMLSSSSRVLIAGDWITNFSYLKFDGKNLTYNNYNENSILG